MQENAIRYLKEINEKQSEIDSLTEQVEALKKTIAEKESAVEEAKKLLLDAMQKENITEFKDESNRLFANVFSKTNIGYSSDAEVISKLKKSGFSKFIKTKITESLDKNPLKKEIKNNKELEELLKPLIKESTTSWVVVTGEENHTRMLEHIEKGSDK